MSATGTNQNLKLNLRHVRVGDVMHQAIVGVPPETPLATVAGLMATQHIHAVAVVKPGQRDEWRIVSSLDLVAAAIRGTDPVIADIRGRKVLAVSAGESVQHAAQLMAEHGRTHLIVTDPASGHPSGVLSTLDIVAALAAPGD